MPPQDPPATPQSSATNQLGTLPFGSLTERPLLEEEQE